MTSRFCTQVLSRLLLTAVLCSGCHSRQTRQTPVADRRLPPPPPPHLIHLPGIAGEREIDHELLRGLKDGGVEGTSEIIDWTGDNAGLNALFARKQNEQEAADLAERITARARQEPRGRIVITAHSGGTGILVWALERLPDDVSVDDVLLIASALSPSYDLSPALSRVRGKAYSLSSPNDALVLGLGTQLFRTIDGQKTEAAGRGGFRRPARPADPAQYDKLMPMPYDPAWMEYGLDGVRQRRRPHRPDAPRIRCRHPCPDRQGGARARGDTHVPRKTETVSARQFQLPVALSGYRNIAMMEC